MDCSTIERSRVVGEGWSRNTRMCTGTHYCMHLWVCIGSRPQQDYWCNWDYVLYLDISIMGMHLGSDKDEEIRQPRFWMIGLSLPGEFCLYRGIWRGRSDVRDFLGIFGISLCGFWTIPKKLMKVFSSMFCHASWNDALVKLSFIRYLSMIVSLHSKLVTAEQQ